MALADVLQLGGLDDEAGAALAEAEDLYRRKGNVAALRLFAGPTGRMVGRTADPVRRERR